MKGVILSLLALLLAGCGRFAPPAAPDGVVWGIGYQVVIWPHTMTRPDGVTIYGRAEGYRVMVAQDWQIVDTVAHELAHVWQWHHKYLPRGGVEAHADAVTRAVIRAGCETGDLGWPGGEVTDCTLPDPRHVTP